MYKVSSQSVQHVFVMLLSGNDYPLIIVKRILVFTLEKSAFAISLFASSLI